MVGVGRYFRRPVWLARQEMNIIWIRVAVMEEVARKTKIRGMFCRNTTKNIC